MRYAYRDVSGAVAAAVGHRRNLTSLAFVHEVPLVWNRLRYTDGQPQHARSGGFLDSLHLALLPALTGSLEELTVRGDCDDAIVLHGLRVEAVAAVCACSCLTRLTLDETRYCSGKVFVLGVPPSNSNEKSPVLTN